ncbi:MAG: hypothetical protein R3B07_04625 [Polyangiaceae bacterium]
MRRTPSLLGLFTLLVGCGPVGDREIAPGAPSPADSSARCPRWTPITFSHGSLPSLGQHAVEPTPDAIDAALQSGELLEAAALANKAWQRCLAEDSVTAIQASRLEQSLERARAALSAPKRGAEYVTEAQQLTKQHAMAEANASWTRAQFAYRRETNEEPQRVVSIPPAAPKQDVCRSTLATTQVPDTRVEAWEVVGKRDERLWKLFRTDGSLQFEGRASSVAPITSDSWLVFGEQVELWREHQEPQQLGVPGCRSRFRRLGDWLIGSVAGGTAWALNLPHPERSFSKQVNASSDIEVARVGPYIRLNQALDEGVRTQIVFPADMTNPALQVWTPSEALAGPELQFFYVPKQGGVLVRRSVYVPPSKSDIPSWQIEATQLDTGKRLARVMMPLTSMSLPAATVDPRHGLVVTGEGRNVRAATLGSTSSRKLAAKVLVGRVTHVATVDGTVCTDQVYIRYYSCALHVTADLLGAGREHTPNRFCLNNATGAWSGVVTPEPGLAHIGSGGANVSEVCGERLSPDGSQAAFLEVKPRKDAARPYAGAVVVVVDTKTGRHLKRLRVPGEMSDPQPFIDVSFSPEGDYLGVLFNHRAFVYRLSDGMQVGTDLAADGWRALVWVGRTAFSGGNAGDRVAALNGDEFRLQPTDAESADERCAFGELLTPAEVCVGQPEATARSRR